MATVHQITEANVALSDWDLFWSEYPRKKAKLDAQKAWRQTEGIRPPLEKVLAAINVLCAEHDFRADPNGQWLPYPATWLRNGQWDDE